MRLIKIFCAILALTLLTSMCGAADFSFRGTSTDLNRVQTFTFAVSSGSTVVIRTFGYAGGTNAAGVLIPAGGFDPVVALFHGSGSSALLYDLNDDAFQCAHVAQDPISHQCYDAYLEEKGASLDPGTLVGGLEAGTYTVVLMNYANFANGPTLGDGFTGRGGAFDCFGASRPVTPGVFLDCDGLSRTGDWALDSLSS